MTLRMQKHFLLLWFVAVCVFVVTSQTANACSCGPTPTVLDSYDGSDVVIIARAVAVEKAPPDSNKQYVNGIRTTTVVVEKIFKGNLKVRDELVFGQGGGADCIWTFDEASVGHQFLFYLDLPQKINREYLDPGFWYAGGCGRSTGLAGATEDRLYLDNMAKLRGKTRISGVFGGWQNPDLNVEGKTIRITGEKKTYEVKTDKHGVFEIYGLPPGKYLLEPEIPDGWKLDPYWLQNSPSIPGDEEPKWTKQVPILLEAKKHARLEFIFEIANAVRGAVYDPQGRPMFEVCVYLLAKDGDGGGGFDCTDEKGLFEITSITTGDYVLVANKDGKLSSSAPFRTLYYPNVSERAKAAVISIHPGEIINDLNIVVPKLEETITVEGVLRYSDGKPVADERVEFAGTQDEKTDGRVSRRTDDEGRFSLKIIKGLKGELSAEDYVYVGEYMDCPKLDSLIRKTGRTNTTIKTNILAIQADHDLFNLELSFPFPACKKAKE